MGQAAANQPPHPLPPVAIFHGPERFLLLEHTQRLHDQLVKTHGEINVATFDGASASPADILDECRSMNLMMTHKLVIVENADQLLKAAEESDDDAAPAAKGRRGGKSARELFEAYADAPESTATLVLRAEAWRPGNLDKAVARSKGVVIKCEPIDPAGAVAWAIQRAKSQHGAALEPAAAERLVDATGPDLGRIDMELAKLALFEPGKPITPGAVAALSAMTREEDFWLIQSSLISGDAKRALSHLRELLDVSRHDPTPLLFTYFDLARKLHGLARGLAARENPRSLMGKLRIWGPGGEALIAKAAQVRPEQAARLMNSIVEGTTRTRTGRGDAERVLEALTLEFASVCRA